MNSNIQKLVAAWDARPKRYVAFNDEEFVTWFNRLRLTLAGAMDDLMLVANRPDQPPGPGGPFPSTDLSPMIMQEPSTRILQGNQSMAGIDAEIGRILDSIDTPSSLPGTPTSPPWCPIAADEQRVTYPTPGDSSTAQCSFPPGPPPGTEETGGA